MVLLIVLIYFDSLFKLKCCFSSLCLFWWVFGFVVFLGVVFYLCLSLFCFGYCRCAWLGFGFDACFAGCVC